MELILEKQCVTVWADENQWLAFMNVRMIFGFQKKEQLDQLNDYYLFKKICTTNES